LIAKFVGQVGAFFWELHAVGEGTDDEIALIVKVLGYVYRRLGLRHSGSLPGIKHADFKDQMMLAVPSLNFNFFVEDWAEYLWDNAQEKWARLPQALGPLAFPPFEPGLEFIINEGGLLNVLEDIGCLKILAMQMELVEVNVTNRRLFRSFLNGEKRSRRARYTNFCPAWFNDVFYSHKDGPFGRFGRSMYGQEQWKW